MDRSASSSCISRRRRPNSTISSAPSNSRRRSISHQPGPRASRPPIAGQRPAVLKLRMSSDPASRAGAVLEIDLGGIVANWRLLAEKAARAACGAVVKANGYGLGAAPVARALAAAGCRLFFVATLDEGIALRGALGADPEIAVFNGPLPGTAAEFTLHRLIPVLNDPGQIDTWRTAPLPHRGRGTGPGRQGWEGEGVGFDRPSPGSLRSPPSPAMRERDSERSPSAILHVDTGMARLGLSAREFAALADQLPKSGIAWRAVISHLACADTPDHPLNEQQRSRFAAAVQKLPGMPAGLAASSGIFLGPPYHFDLVRPRAALHGLNPQPRRPNPLRQVVRLTGKIMQGREIDRGEAVGFGTAHGMK